MVAALAYEPDGSHAELVFSIRSGAYNDEPLIDTSPSCTSSSTTAT